MAKHAKNVNGTLLGLPVEVKSKFDAEFRRFSVDKNKLTKCDDFYQLVESLHKLKSISFLITYTDSYGDQLPINNDDNFMKALVSVKGLLRLQLQRKGETPASGFGTLQLRPKKNPITKLISSEVSKPARRPQIAISYPEDFRRVSAIIDVDIVPETHRRVKLMKNGSDKPLGFYIRDGVSVRITPKGLEKVPGIYISRLVPGGLAESTGLLAVNDEVLEVNGIEVTNKTLDQVTDMMVANSSNLIITVKPVNQSNTLASRHHHLRQSRVSNHSHHSVSGMSVDSDELRDYMLESQLPSWATAGSPPGSTREEDEDEVCEHPLEGAGGGVDESVGEVVDEDGEELLTL